MTAQRFQCIDRPCSRYARVTVQDAEGERACACARHAVGALDHLAQARVVWEDTRSINEHEAAALRLAEERSQLSRRPRPHVRHPGWAGRRPREQCQQALDT
jgi:hypothetical protein